MKRAKPLIPLSRTHKTVLFIGESCKTNGARFTGYPTDVTCRFRILLDYQPDLTVHFQNLQRAFTAIEPLVSDELKTLLIDLTGAQNALLDSIGSLNSGTASDNELNEIGLELVRITRLCEREAFQQIQVEIPESSLEQLLSS